MAPLLLVQVRNKLLGRFDSEYYNTIGGGIMKAVVFLLVVLVGLNSMAQAADDQSQKPNQSNLNSGSSAPVSGDIDNEITNARLRAVSGAKSAWSFSSNFNYAGSTILTPFSSIRPQLNSQNNLDATNINGQMAVKYRMTEHDSLLMGFGIQFTPGYTDPNSGAAIGAVTTASSPYLDYSRAFRIGTAQNVVDISISKYTLANDMNNGLSYALSAGDQVMFDIGQSKLEVGAAAGWGQDILSGQMMSQGLPVPDYLLSQIYIEPVAEYAISDKIQLRTVYRMLLLNQDSNNRSIWATPSFQSQSIGIGYGVTRDIYLYPNMQWSWSHISADATTVGFTANINL